MLSRARTCRNSPSLQFHLGTQERHKGRGLQLPGANGTVEVSKQTQKMLHGTGGISIHLPQTQNNFLAALYQHSSFLTWKSSTAISVLNLFWPEMETCQNMQEYCQWGVLKGPLGLQTHFYTSSEQGCEPRCLEIDYCINLLCHLSAFVTISHCISWTRLHFSSVIKEVL